MPYERKKLKTSAKPKKYVHPLDPYITTEDDAEMVEYKVLIARLRACILEVRRALRTEIRRRDMRICVDNLIKRRIHAYRRDPAKRHKKIAYPPEQEQLENDILIQCNKCEPRRIIRLRTLAGVLHTRGIVPPDDPKKDHDHFTWTFFQTAVTENEIKILKIMRVPRGCLEEIEPIPRVDLKDLLEMPDDYYGDEDESEAEGARAVVDLFD